MTNGQGNYRRQSATEFIDERMLRAMTMWNISWAVKKTLTRQNVRKSSAVKETFINYEDVYGKHQWKTASMWRKMRDWRSA